MAEAGDPAPEGRHARGVAVGALVQRVETDLERVEAEVAGGSERGLPRRERRPPDTLEQGVRSPVGEVRLEELRPDQAGELIGRVAIVPERKRPAVRRAAEAAD